MKIAKTKKIKKISPKELLQEPKGKYLIKEKKYGETEKSV